ncbi:MAG: AbrB/MazE/SpoVT family DNA-binding domain-containing protein [Spirochaetales bacterium]|nr:AbrB/MazE/SpoVT family DNA-binding domain-containing protein [Spirochaetales bacterium]
MVKQLIRHGNSAAIILDKPILELLNVKMDTSLEITTDGKNIIISPMVKENAENDLLKSLKKVNKKHSETLRKLGM